MCDTMVALGSVTADGSVLFAKNSDREPNEAQAVIYVPRTRHEPGSSVQCTYIEIPQVPETYAVLLCQPWWIWGAEMGANEHGVVIGNEAVFTRVPHEDRPGLIGMDLLRLALERSVTAFEALQIITQLIETYGQSGNCGMTHKLYYHNSFLIADRKEAWVLETAGRQWAAEQVRDVRTISNAITIGDRWDLASEGLIDYAIDQGWCKRREEFHFARCYSDFLYTQFSDARRRQCRTMERLEAERGRITPATMMEILRDHGPHADERWTPARGWFGATVCMHAGWGPVRVSQTAGSMVSRLSAEGDTHWLTATAAPCTGIFKPVWMDATLPDLGPAPKGQYDAATLWWRHEALHREVLRNYPARLTAYRAERDEMEARFVEQALAATCAPAEERARLSERCFQEANEALDRWLARVREIPAVERPSLYTWAWRRFNRQAKMPI